jgi:uncharacterized ParB-like nuclease family protein
MIKLTNNTLFSIFYKGNVFFKVNEREKRGKEKTLSKLYRAWGGCTHLTTIERAARRIKRCPKMWCLANEKNRIRQQLSFF